MMRVDADETVATPRPLTLALVCECEHHGAEPEAAAFRGPDFTGLYADALSLGWSLFNSKGTVIGPRCRKALKSDRQTQGLLL